MNKLFLQAIESKLFQPYWYMKEYNLFFGTEEEAFFDYIHKSRFSNINPSRNFDGTLYINNNPGVIENGFSPLEHYLKYGKDENRNIHKSKVLSNINSILKYDTNLCEEAKNLKVAITFHIYYVDFIEKYNKALENFPMPFDLYITINDKNSIPKANETFSKNPMLQNIKCVEVPNKGRNFGPLLVEFAKDLQKYDIFAHLHSKKSLFSGREQTQWADYVIEYLLKDKQVITGMLNLFAKNKKLGMYYPRTFWNLPYWANHWLKNYHIAKQLHPTLKIENSFFSYPVSGMFWSRPEAIADVLNKDYSYDDFPNEPLGNDGTSLHVIERIISSYCEKNNFKQFYYYPTHGNFSLDNNYIFDGYKERTYENLEHDTMLFDSLSFDLFDTLFTRKYFYADYAKKLLGDELVEQNLFKDSKEFVTLRNITEHKIREKKNFIGDVSIDEIYLEISKKLFKNEEKAKYLAKREFELDLDMFVPRKKIVEIINNLAKNGKKIYFITDTFYNKEQIEKIIAFCGINKSYELMVSSDNGLRKDNGTVWEYIKQNNLINLPRHLHIGDNVVSDTQVPGDFGFQTSHILNPMDKWLAIGNDTIDTKDIIFDDKKIIFYGSLIAKNGFNPYFK
jgi:FMN phosphatase YigB (HAD superfamily)